MTASHWLENKGSYAEGIDILISHDFPILEILKRKEPTLRNKAWIIPQIEAIEAKSERESIGKRIQYSTLPPELRIKYKTQSELFYKLCNLKIELNDLSEDKEEESFCLQEEILHLRQQIDVIWAELKYYSKNKKSLNPIPRNTLNGMSDIEKMKKKNSLASSISNRKRRLSAYKNSLTQETDKSKQKELEHLIEKKEIELKKIELDFIKIKSQINGRK